MKPADPIHGVTICPDCLRSVVVEGKGRAATVRVATGADTAVLTPEQLAQVRGLRRAAREARR